MLEGDWCKTTAGDVLLYPSESWHTDLSSTQSPVGMFYICFEGAGTPHFAKIQDRNGRIRTLARWLYDVHHSPNNSNEPRCQAFFQAILEEFEDLKNRTEKLPLAGLVHSYVLKSMDQPLTLDVLAREAKLSVRHLARLYQAETGGSPMEDVRRIRLEHARDMYERTLLPLKAIAPRVGYNSEHELSKAFRRHFGYPLAQLRSRKTRE